MTFTNFTTVGGNSFGGKYLEIVPDEKLKVWLNQIYRMLKNLPI
jgi:hypothetical protein